MLSYHSITTLFVIFTNNIIAQSTQPDGSVLNYHVGDHSHEQYGFPGRAVDGSYGFVSPEGTVVTVNYVADENGYRAQVFKAPSQSPYYAPVGWSSPSALSASSGPSSAQGPRRPPFAQPNDRPTSDQGFGSGQQQTSRPSSAPPASPPSWPHFNAYYNPYYHNRYWYDRCRNSGQYNCHRYSLYWHHPSYPYHHHPYTYFRRGH